jgi:predicted dehydrogenase
MAAMSRGVTLDAVHVLVPSAAHANTAMDCLDKGWHVLVEKPFATTPEE